MRVLADFSLADLIISMMWFFLLFIWIWLLISVFADLFRSEDLSGGAKALWVIFVILFPYLGVFVYLIARGGKMHERALRQAQRSEAEFRQYVQSVAGAGGAGGGGGSVAEELHRLADLRDRGVVSDEEFQRLKANLVSGPAG